MSNITLFQQHENYLMGGGKLHKKAVCQFGFFHALALIALIVLSISFFAFTIIQKKLQDQFQSMIQVTDATVVSCSESFTSSTRGETSYTSLIRFSYEADGQIYYGESSDSGQLCSQIPINTTFNLKYMRNEPQRYGTTFSVPGRSWTVFLMGGFAFLIGACALILFNRYEARKYRRLQASDTVLEANVVEVGTRYGRFITQFAKYKFRTPEGKTIQDEITSGKRYPYPRQIQWKDRLNILYLDDKTYCVL